MYCLCYSIATSWISSGKCGERPLLVETGKVLRFNGQEGTRWVRRKQKYN